MIREKKRALPRCRGRQSRLILHGVMLTVLLIGLGLNLFFYYEEEDLATGIDYTVVANAGIAFLAEKCVFQFLLKSIWILLLASCAQFESMLSCVHVDLFIDFLLAVNNSKELA